MIKTSELIWQDAQHQVLFRLIDQIKEDLFDRNILSKLQLYAEDHFVLEETYMARLNYPDAKAHIHAHNRFRKELANLIETPVNADVQIRESLSLFLSEWLKRHIFGVDKDLEKFILESNVK